MTSWVNPWTPSNKRKNIDVGSKKVISLCKEIQVVKPWFGWYRIQLFWKIVWKSFWIFWISSPLFMMGNFNFLYTFWWKKQKETRTKGWHPSTSSRSWTKTHLKWWTSAWCLLIQAIRSIQKLIEIPKKIQIKSKKQKDKALEKCRST